MQSISAVGVFLGVISLKCSDDAQVWVLCEMIVLLKALLMLRNWFSLGFSFEVIAV
jgi:hypothetical protein